MQKTNTYKSAGNRKITGETIQGGNQTQQEKYPGARTGDLQITMNCKHLFSPQDGPKKGTDSLIPGLLSASAYGILTVTIQASSSSTHMHECKCPKTGLIRETPGHKKSHLGPGQARGEHLILTHSVPLAE